MASPIFFQWQNEHLLRTIYPLRELKLRDFLVAYFDIDIWQEYKDKTPQDIPEEIDAYCENQRRKLQNALETYQQLEEYFFNPDVSEDFQAAFPAIDPMIMVKINDLHAVVKRYFPSYQNPVKEKYFLSERVRQCETMRKDVLFQISEKHRIVRNMGSSWPKKPAYEAEAERLKSQAVPMVERELGRLNQFVSAYERLGRYRQELQKRKALRQKERDATRTRVIALRGEEDGVQSQLFSALQALRRMQSPPDYDQVRNYFIDEDVTDHYQQRFEQIDPGVMLKINQLHATFKQYFPHYQSPVQERYFLGQRLQEFRDYNRRKHQELADRERTMKWTGISEAARTGFQQEIDLLRGSALPMVDEELAKLEDFQWAFDLRSKPAENLPAQIAQKQQDRANLEIRLRKIKDELQDHEAVLDQADIARNAREKDQMFALIDPRAVTVKDVVREHVENFRAELSEKSHQELLELVVKAFTDKPARYPLWLQYMVIHFSGMRYQSAHGSWADPRGLLISLRMRFIELKLRKIGPDGVLAQAEQRRLLYQAVRQHGSVLSGAPGEAFDLPDLAQTTDKAWLDKIDLHLKHLDPDHWYNKHKALLDLRIDEEEYEIERLGDREILEGLRDLKDDLPNWMWEEIVRVTELKLTEVVDANWEQLSAEDLEKRNESQMAAFRVIMNKWKAEHLTGWREEHDLTNQLIVTGAVCNEVAEHIQHVRGNTAPGGLTAKPEWYRRKEKDVFRAAEALGGATGSLPDDRPFLLKPRAASDFKEGASILWLSWVHKFPPPWQITRPMALQSGELLLNDMHDALNDVRNAGDHYQRTVTVIEKDEEGRPNERSFTQYLRWLHEATVVEVTETADGPTIFTFETALPTDDKRQATIGVFKRMASDLRHQAAPSWLNGTFVGYMPPGKMAFESLEKMLDWNHILLREAFTPEQLKSYWEAVGRPAGVSFGEGIEVEREETLVEIAPRLAPHRVFPATHCYEIPPGSGEATFYEPDVSLRRGLRLTVCKDEFEQVGGERYFPVVRCIPEPRAIDLYIRASDVIEIGEGEGVRAMVARDDLPLYRLYGVDGFLRPSFEPGDMTLVEGTTVFVSTVHCLNPDEANGGVLRSKTGQQFYLIADCPRKPSAAGWFVRKKDLKNLRRARRRK